MAIKIRLQQQAAFGRGRPKVERPVVVQAEKKQGLYKKVLFVLGNHDVHSGDLKRAGKAAHASRQAGTAPAS